MQTFLTHPNFYLSARSLDSKRLNKQRVECKQIYAACVGVRETPAGLVPAKGWINHPAVKMWRGYERQLCDYALAVCIECDRRGIADKTDMYLWFSDRSFRHRFVLPHWIADESLYDSIIHSHRANLVRKDPAHYEPQFGPLEWVPYVWPSAQLTTI